MPDLVTQKPGILRVGEPGFFFLWHFEAVPTEAHLRVLVSTLFCGSLRNVWWLEPVFCLVLCDRVEFCVWHLALFWVRRRMLRDVAEPRDKHVDGSIIWDWVTCMHVVVDLL